MRRWGVGLAVALLALLGACEGDDGGGGGAADTVVAADTGPGGTGPASACGGVAIGQWVSGEGVGAAGEGQFVLELDAAGGTLDMSAREAGDVHLMAYVDPEAGATVLARSDDGLAVTLSGTTARGGSVSGHVFDRITSGLHGGFLSEGRLCFDGAPTAGQPLSGSYVFVVSVVEEGTLEETLYRVQGSFAVPGEAVLAADAATLTIRARPGAEVTVD